MKIHAKIKKYISDHYSDDGTWTGSTVDGNAVVTIDGTQYDLIDVLIALRYPVDAKYIEEEDNEGMGESYVSGDIQDAGDGTS